MTRIGEDSDVGERVDVPCCATVYCGLSAASPQDVSKLPTMTNHAESRKARSAGGFIRCQRRPTRRLQFWVNERDPLKGQVIGLFRAHGPHRVRSRTEDEVDEPTSAVSGAVLRRRP